MAVANPRIGVVVVANPRTGAVVVLNSRMAVAVNLHMVNVGNSHMVVAVDSHIVVAVNSHMVVVANPHMAVAANSHMAVAVNLRTGAGVVNPRTGASGARVVDLHTVAVVVNLRNGVVHHGALHGHRLVEDQAEWSRMENTQAQKELARVHSHSPLAEVALRNPQREARRNGVLEGPMAACT